jgi:hypothetical protein
MSDSRVRRSRLFRATPRRHPDAGTSFGSQAAHDRQTVREPDARMSRRYGRAAPRESSINQTDRSRRRSASGGRVGRMPMMSARPRVLGRYRTRHARCPRTASGNRAGPRPGPPGRCRSRPTGIIPARTEAEALGNPAGCTATMPNISARYSVCSQPVLVSATGGYIEASWRSEVARPSRSDTGAERISDLLSKRWSRSSAMSSSWRATACE